MAVQLVDIAREIVYGRELETPLVPCERPLGYVGESRAFVMVPSGPSTMELEMEVLRVVKILQSKRIGEPTP